MEASRQGSVRVLVLRAAGTNCDEETAHAFEVAGAAAELIHFGTLLRRERRLGEFDILALAGGFSYGDDLGAGTVLANRLRAHLEEDLEEFVNQGRLVIGICNGFQVLVRLGLLPGWKRGFGSGGEKVASLIENASGKFEDRWVHLRVDTKICQFLRAPLGAHEPRAGSKPPGTDGPEREPTWGSPFRAARGNGSSLRLEEGTVLRLPVAHREGRFVVRSPEVLERLKASGQIALTYVRAAQQDGCATEYPLNPNGSVEGIAGITNEAGNVLGLMPHPERHLYALNDTQWTRSIPPGGIRLGSLGDGYLFFENAVRHVEGARRG